VPQTGAYADEGADELRAYELAVEHINVKAAAACWTPSPRRF
jgi:ABC-type branched-subunit amino acid transport system substrate-binding protein